jgi:predicted  nucleic acid-binding Zn-ribbon protein
MMNLPNHPTYSSGRTVKARNLQYLSRPADQQVLECCREGQPAFILTSPQMGKSSLIARTAERLKNGSAHPVIFDLSQFPLPPRKEEWFQRIFLLLEQTLDLSDEASDWWEDHASVPLVERLTQFIELVVLKELPGSLILFFDEIEQTLTAPFRQEIFSWLASLYQARTSHPPLQRVNFVICGVATPGQLIPAHTPHLFDWSREVVLSDFTVDEVLPLAESLSLPDENGKTVIEWVYQWTNGHPYLTQLLCQVIEEQNRSTWTEVEVGACIETFLLSPQGVQDRNLQIVRCALTEPSFSGMLLLEPYLKLLQGQGHSIKTQPPVMEALRLAGVVRETPEAVTVRNRVYLTSFPLEWVKSHLPPTVHPGGLSFSKPYLVAASLLLLSVGFAFGFLQNTSSVPPDTSFTEVSEAPLTDTSSNPSDDKLKGTIEVQQDALAEADKKIKGLEATLQQYQAMNDNEVQHVTAQVSALQTQLNDKQDSLEEARHTIETLEQALADAQHTHTQVAAKLQGERDQLESQYASSQDDLAHTREQLNALQTTVLSQSTLPPSEIKTLLADRSQMETRLKTVTRELAESHGRTRELESLLDQQKQVTATERNRQSESLSRLEAQLREKDLALERTKQTFAKTEQSLKEQLRLSQTELARIQDDRSQLQDQMTSRKAEIADYRDRLARLEASNAQQRQTLETMKREQEHTAAQLQEASKQGTQWQEQIAALTTQLNQNHQEANHRQTVMQDIQTTSRELSQRNESLVTDLLNSRRALETQLMTVQDTLRQTQQKVLQLESDQPRLASLQKDITQASADRDRLSSELQEKTHQLEKANQEVKHLQATLKQTPPSAAPGGSSADSISNTPSAASGKPIETARHSAISRVLPVITTAISSSNRFSKSDSTRLLWARQAYLFGIRTGGAHWASIDKVLRDHLRATPISFPAASGRINTLAFHPLGSQLASGISEGSVMIWNPGNPKQPPKRLPGHSAGVQTISYSPDGKFLASGSLDTSIRVFSLDTPDVAPLVLDAHIKGVTSLAFSPDGKTLASGSQDHTIRLWDLSSQSPTNTTLGTHAGWVNAIAFTPDGRFLISAGDDLTLRIWDVRRPNSSPHLLHGHTQSISTLAVHPSGSTIASGGRDQQIALWDLRDLSAPPQFLIGHAGRVSHVEFSPDGHSLISVSSDKTTRIWDWRNPSTGPVILSNQKGSLDTVAVSPDGFHVATGGGQKILTLWAVTPQLVETVCDGVQQNLSLSEWQELVGSHLPYERTCTNLPLHPSFIEEAKNLARKGDADKARQLFERAKFLDSSLDLDPKKEVEKLTAKS